MILGVTGGRSYDNRGRMYAVLDAVHFRYPISLLVHGACHKGGADIIAEDWAKNRCVAYLGDPADKERWPGAGPERNGRLIRVWGIEYLIAFPGGRGTANMLMLAGRAGLPHLSVVEEASLEQIVAALPRSLRPRDVRAFQTPG